MSKSQKNSWWAKVVFDEFASHFFGMSREEIADDIQESVKKVLAKNGEGNSFGAFMVRIAEERIQKNREARVTIPSMRKSAEEVVKLPAECIYGKFENVYLTQDEYNSLLTDIGNFNELKDIIENLSAKLEDGNTKSDNHFATLTSWIQYRKKMDSEGKQTKQFVDHNTQVFANGLKYLEEKYGK